ncbi:MAG: hypothetical protein WD851_01905 [Pirellulales bacterium]
MKRLVFSCLVGMLAVGVPLVPVVQAEHPEFLKHFQIVPRLSTLGITGGFAGVHERYRLIGEYDFHYGFHHDTIPRSFASFENAEVWGSIISDLPTIAIVLDVDERLNLEGLKGEQLPVAAPFDVYKFTGPTSDGSDLTLFAAVRGPWMYVRGGSQPPQGGADFFDYHLRMVARSRPFADFNDDGVVDLADYTVLRDSQASATASGAIGGTGWSDWQSQFGERVPDFGALDDVADAAFAGAASGVAVPELSSVVLMLLGALLLARVIVWRR